MLRAFVFIVLLLPGGAFYGFNKVGVSNDVFLLIFGQILPFFLIFFVPFAFGDYVCVKCNFLDNVDQEKTWITQKLLYGNGDSENPNANNNTESY